MLRTLTFRLIQGIIVLLLLYTATFFLVRQLPGSPFDQEKALPEHIKAQMEANYGLDQPLPVQYTSGLARMVQGDFGISIMLERPVTNILAHAFPVSLRLGLIAMGFALILGIPAGIIAAARKNQLPDFAMMGIAMIGICLPSFVIGPLLAEYLGARLGLFPASGWGEPLSFFLPAFTLSLATAAYISRLTRAGMLEILTSDYIRTARAKGLSEPAILVKHALRGALVPVVAFLGPALAAIVSGSIIIESVFNLPGMGNIFIKAIELKDSFLLEGAVVLYGLLIVIGIILSDLLQYWLNPRLRAN